MKISCVTLLFFILLAFEPGTDVALAQMQPQAALAGKNILILHDLEFNVPILVATNRGLMEALESGGISIRNQFYENLDFGRNPEPEHRKKVAELLRQRYSNRHVDLIITTYAGALKFALNEGHTIFSQAPIIALYLAPGIEISESTRVIYRHSTAVDPSSTLESALKLLPKTKQELFRTAEARRTVVLTLVSAVAGTYVEILALDKQIEITQRTVETRRKTLDYFQMRFDKGIISEVDVSQAEAEYQDALARLPELELAIARAENALSVLLGQNPGPIPRGRTIDELTLPEIPSGLPSDLLERRPDLRAAEQALIAANAQIGVAKSLYFPTISLTGAFGWASIDLSELFNDSAEAWNWGVPVSVPLFSAGRIGGEVKASEAIQQQLLYSYLQTVQNAFREVDNALVEHAKSQQKLDTVAKRVRALQNYARLARVRYDEGLTSYLEVLDAERSLFTAEIAYADTLNELFRSMTNVYKSMGGGWVETAEAKMTSQPVQEAGFVP